MHSIRFARVAPKPCRQFVRKFSSQIDALWELEQLWLSDANRVRSMEALKQAPPVGVKLKQTDSERPHAAVLIALCIDKETQRLSLLFTRRSAMLSRHKRQISFPGGLRDNTDSHYIDCALRETEEEIGLHRDRIEVWGEGSLVRPPHTAAIMPVVGLVREFDLTELNLNPKEVEEVIIVPVAALVNPNSFGYTQFKSGFSSPVFLIGEHSIWGVTGFITYNFLNCFVPKELGGLQKRIKFVRPYKAMRS